MTKITRYLIDADSQFTCKVGPPLLLDATKFRRIRNSFMPSGFGFGHFIFGDNHNIFAVHLARISRQAAEAIGSDIRTKLERLRKAISTEFSRRGSPKEIGGPDFLIYPTTSAVAHFVRDNPDLLPSAKIRRLSPAFLELGRTEHRIEPQITEEEVKRSISAGSFFVVYLDDSLSSGRTERSVIDAVLADYANHISRLNPERKPLIIWCTYTILHRSTIKSPVQPTGMRIPAETIDLFIRYHSLEFCHIPSISVPEQQCPFCAASRRMEMALFWSRKLPANIHTELQWLHDLLRVRHSDASDRFDTFLNPEESLELLQLCGCRASEVCASIIFHRAVSIWSPRALQFYLALHYKEVRAYVSDAQLRDIVILLFDRSYADMRPGADNVRPDIENATLFFLFVFALHETSFALAALQEPTSLARLCRLPTPALLGLLALTLPSHFRLISSRSSIISLDPNLNHAVAQQHLEVAKIFHAIYDIESQSSTVDPVIQQSIEIVRRHLISIGTEPSSDSPSSVARILSLRLSHGDHEPFLPNQIMGMTTQNFGSVFSQSLEVLALLKQFYTTHLRESVRDIEDLIHSTERDYDNLQRGTAIPGRLEHARKSLIEGLEARWIDSSRVQALFGTANDMAVLLNKALWQLRNDRRFISSGLADKLGKLIVLPPTQSKEPYKWVCLAGGPHVLADHFRNLLSNPFLHFDHEAATHRTEYEQIEYLKKVAQVLAKSSAPLIAVSLECNIETQSVQLLVADRAVAAIKQNLFWGTHGLALTRSNLSNFGGSVDHETLARGLTRERSSSLATSINEAQHREFRNLFITSLPLVSLEPL